MLSWDEYRTQPVARRAARDIIAIDGNVRDLLTIREAEHLLLTLEVALSDQANTEDPDA